MSTAQPWPAEARAAVERVIHEQVPTLTRGPIGTEFVTDAVLDTLAPFLAATQAAQLTAEVRLLCQVCRRDAVFDEPPAIARKHGRCECPTAVRRLVTATIVPLPAEEPRP